ncbi:nodulin-related protein 2-like [Salvia miltiorrhiza]|uniref:nodulin-related protein 2-like n=1 Tax=Salvia miltiorrhiza TaxID=226208 RepID=UPI0025ABBA75|nr:nodulin-related protein 2-like [Salvia miltiorrhiza]
MDSLSSLAKGGGDAKPQPAEEKSAAADLLTSAKEAGAAAQSGVTSAPAKAAGAAADLLDAASEYAKLDESKGVGKYVDQAENYLRDYSKQPAAAGTEGGGAGDYIKKAQEFFTQPSEGSAADKKEPESGEGGLLKAAAGFFNK